MGGGAGVAGLLVENTLEEDICPGSMRPVLICLSGGNLPKTFVFHRKSLLK